MRTQLHACQRGLSLVELLLGLAISALVLGSLVPMLQTATAAASMGSEQKALQRDADFALERIAARIRMTKPSFALSDKPSTDWLSPAVYSVVNGILYETQGKDQYLLTESVTGFTLSAPPSSGAQPLVKVTLSLARGTSSTTAVALVRMGTAP